MTFLLSLALLNAYHLRVVLNIAIVEMQAPKNHTNLINACPMYKSESVETPEGKFNWPNSIEAFILYAFYIGYIVSHIPGGWLSDKFGGKWIVGICMLVSIITNLVYPLVIKLTDYYGAVALRVIIGLSQGPIYPTISTFLQCWIPEEERSLIGSIMFSGATLGTVSGGILTGEIIQFTHSWAAPFYVWGAIALIWWLFYVIWVYSRPTTHPFISEKELTYLKYKVEGEVSMKTPWKDILTCVPVYALLAGQFGHNLLFFTLFTNLPKYMKEILKVNLRSNTLFYSLPFLLLWIVIFISGYVAEVFEHKMKISLIFIRKSFTLISCLVPSIFLILVPYVGCNRTWAIILNTLAVACLGPSFSGTKVNVNDITMHHAGLIMAGVNGMGAIAGIIGPFIVGALTKNQSLEEWMLVFWILGGVSTGLSLLFVFFAEADRQPWDIKEDVHYRTSRSFAVVS